MGIAAIAQRRGHGAAIEGHLAHEVVDRAGGDAGFDHLRDLVEDFRREPPRAAHPFEAGLIVKS